VLAKKGTREMNKSWEQLEEMYSRVTTRAEESTMIWHYRAYAIKAREELELLRKAQEK
jgi:hypothetical protein